MLKSSLRVGNQAPSLSFSSEGNNGSLFAQDQLKITVHIGLEERNRGRDNKASKGEPHRTPE